MVAGAMTLRNTYTRLSKLTSIKRRERSQGVSQHLVEEPRGLDEWRLHMRTQTAAARQQHGRVQGHHAYGPVTSRAQTDSVEYGKKLSLAAVTQSRRLGGA